MDQPGQAGQRRRALSLTLATIAQDPSRVTEATPDHIPALLGELERLRATLWARLTAPEDNRRAVSEEDRLLDVSEAATKLTVTTDWLYRHAKKLPFTVRPSPGRVRFSLHGIERYIRQRQGR